jgi:C1A family cysteine protease
MPAFGYRFDLEDRPWLRANQLVFRGSAFTALRVPAEVDPRASMSIRDQLQLGSCSGASRTAIEERLNQLANGTSDKLLLSIMFAYLTNQKCCDCFGADNGATIAGSVQAASKFGICHESLLPYTGEYTTEIPDAASAEGVKHRIASHSEINDFDAAIQYLGTAGVIQIGVPVGQAFQNCSGPLTLQAVQRDARNPEGGHALAVVGYVLPATIGQPAGDGRPWLIGQNSWSAKWGAKGFFFIEPRAWDFWCSQISSGGNVEIDGLSHLQSFDDPSAALDFTGCHG